MEFQQTNLETIPVQKSILPCPTYQVPAVQPGVYLDARVGPLCALDVGAAEDLDVLSPKQLRAPQNSIVGQSYAQKRDGRNCA